jgi:conjugative relaxase-like TrwC/TraI family protein
MQVVRDGGVGYYVRDLVPGRAEGSGVVGESPGQWTGRGAGVLGLRGTVGAAEFTQVLAGQDPLGDRALRAGRGARAVSGVDLLFVAPKAVSLLHLLGPREVAEAAGDAHGAAVADAVGFMERTACGVRRSRGGTVHLMPATGVVSAAFVHRTSRALDPHLHTHLVAANVAQGVDGVWSSIDSRRLFQHRRPLGAVYDASLRHQLSERLGVAWERDQVGRWDVAGIDPVLRRLFSQRSAAIDEYVFRSAGVRPAGARPTRGLQRAAFHADRPDKDAGQTVEGLRARWRTRAADHGLDLADLVQVVGQGRAVPARRAIDREELGARLGITASGRAPVGIRDLVAVVADTSPAGLPSVQIERVADALARSASGPSTSVAGAAHSRAHQHTPGRDGFRWTVEDMDRTLGSLTGVGGPEVPGDGTSARDSRLQIHSERIPGRERSAVPRAHGGRGQEIVRGPDAFGVER